MEKSLLYVGLMDEKEIDWRKWTRASIKWTDYRVYERVKYVDFTTSAMKWCFKVLSMV